MDMTPKLLRTGLPLAALFLAACGGGPDTDVTAEAAPVHAAATVIPPPPIGSPPVPIASPKITSAPQNAVVGNGGGVRFSLGVSGIGPFTFRWYKNGTAIAGATSGSLTFAAAGPSDAATYTVRVTDLGGNTAQASATLQVIAGGWAQLSGRSVKTTASAQQPSMTLCGQPHVATLFPSPLNGRMELFVWSFDGVAWSQKGAVLNATSDGSASDPSVACVSDAAGAWPAVAWSEGNNVSRNIHVRYWNGTQWQAAGTALNIAPGSMAVRPVLRVPPYDANVGNGGNVPVGGITRRAAVAWIENGRPSVRRWNNDWQLLFGGSQIPNASGATDIALKIDLEYQGRYPVVVAWLQAESGGRRPYAAMHLSSTTSDGTERGGWTQLGTPATLGNAPLASPAARIGIATGKLGSPSAAVPIVQWADAATPNTIRSYFYPSASYLQAVASQPWSSFGAFVPASVPKAVYLDPDELSPREFCSASGWTVPIFAVAVSDATGFEVRRGSCGQTTPASWITTGPRHSVSLEEVSLRMAGLNDPYVAGTRFVNGSQYELSVWKYYP